MIIENIPILDNIFKIIFLYTFFLNTFEMKKMFGYYGMKEVLFIVDDKISVNGFHSLNFKLVPFLFLFCLKYDLKFS